MGQKRFDFESIKTRLIAALRMRSDWALILSNGTVGNLLDAISEGNAELARYLEYLLGEKKWLTAMNLSSLISMADLLTYKRRLPVSAVGYVVVSHTDPVGKDRLQYYGNYFFDLDCKSDYDNLEKDEDADIEAKYALTPWVCNDAYIIPKGTRFIAANGVEYFSTEVAISRTLKKGLKDMDASEKELFYKRGGWKGIKYLKVPVMQGIQRSVSIGKTNNTTRFQSFVLPTLDVDAASNEISCKYFSVYIKPTSGGDPVYFIEIDRLSMASSVDNVFEKTILKDESGIKIKFGDGVSGAIPPEGIVYVNYVETLGSSGNIDAKYQINTMVFPSGYAMKDPRTGTYSTFLSCTNTSSILGGKDIEDITEFRKNAPASYLKSYTIATNKAYLNSIKKYSPLNLLHCKIFSDSSISSKQLKTTIGVNNEDNVMDELYTISDNINITALLSNGEQIDDDDIEDSFLNPLQSSLYDTKGPSDNIKFVKPNLIEVVPSFTIKSSSYDYTEEEIKDYVREVVANEYDIFNQEFNEPIYNSKLIALAKSFNFTEAVDVLVEAVAIIDYDDITNDSNNIVRIPFHFDECYLNDEINKGFKDSKVDADYLLKVDLEFINDSSKITKNRTFFLYDNRTNYNTSINDAKNKLINQKTEEERSIKSINEYNPPDINDFDFLNKQVRIAQFDYINNITNDLYMKRLKDFSKSPSENRPYETDYYGNYVKYQKDSPEEGFTATSDSSTEYYKNNRKYVEGVDISFSINEETKSLSGSFYIPLSYFGFSFNNTGDNEKLISLIKQYISLRVYAQPRLLDFNPTNKNDIIYINKNYIKVEKVQL